MFDFLRLPAEVRSIIYRLVFPIAQAFDLDDRSEIPHICHINQQIRSETLSVYRGCNAFRIDIYWQSKYQAPAIFVWHLKSGFLFIHDLVWTESVLLFVPCELGNHRHPDRVGWPYPMGKEQMRKAKDQRDLGVRIHVQGALYGVKIQLPVLKYELKYGRGSNVEKIEFDSVMRRPTNYGPNQRSTQSVVARCRSRSGQSYGG
jgi:hypothetical protein